MATPAFSYNNTTDPRKIAQNQRGLIRQQGDQLIQQNNETQNAENQRRSQTADYLNNIEDPLAQGQGGYNPSELSQIQMTPEQQADIVRSAGITAGAGNAAAVNAAQRAADATGGNPAALAVYRARAQQQEGAQAGDAMTKARVAASDAAAGRAENIGQTRIGQQNQGLNYYQGQNAQANSNANEAANRSLGAYGTETTGSNAAAGQGLQASQTPTTFDKVIGGATGFLSHLEEGGTDAVVGEGGPEKVINFSEQGGSYGDGMGVEASDAIGTPWWKRFGQSLQSKIGQSQGTDIQQQSGVWNPTTPYRDLGALAGKTASMLEDGGRPQGTDGIFTQPTHIKMTPKEMAVPLGYKPHARVRPSVAMMPAAKVGRQPYGHAV